MKNSMYLEHANITVSNLEKSISFFKLAFPQFEIRGSGETNGRKWIHLGNEDTYLALNTPTSSESIEKLKDYGIVGINHLGFVVNDVDKVGSSLLEAGFERSFPKQVEKFRI